MIDQDKERAEFEEFTSIGGLMPNSLFKTWDHPEKGKTYEDSFVECEWQAWQASAARSSARIAELEAEVARLKNGFNDCGYVLATALNALESVGLDKEAIKNENINP